MFIYIYIIYLFLRSWKLPIKIYCRSSKMLPTSNAHHCLNRYSSYRYCTFHMHVTLKASISLWKLHTTMKDYEKMRSTLIIFRLNWWKIFIIKLFQNWPS